MGRPEDSALAWDTPEPEQDDPGTGDRSVQAKLKARLRITNPYVTELLAEFLGTFILISFGDGSVAQHVLSGGAAGHFLTVNIAWGLAVALGVWVAGGGSGGHINPAVTLTFCVLGRLPWSKLVVYWLGQYLGAFVASACVYGVYHDALNAYDGGVRQLLGPNGTAGIWSTYPQDYLSIHNALADQLFGTALLLICVLAITDRHNQAPADGLVPFALGLSVMAIGMAFGVNCGYAINPARDWGPKLFTALAGWGLEPFSYRGYSYFWVPWLGPHLGAILGAFVYLLFVGNHLPTRTRTKTTPLLEKENKDSSL